MSSCVDEAHRSQAGRWANRAVAIAERNVSPAAMVETERMVGNCDAPPAKVGDGLIIVVSDSDIHRAARLHLERHGNEAVAKARDMV